MHYNIALLKNELIALLFMESNITLLFVTWPGLVYLLFLITKKPKVIFLAAVKALSLPPAEGSVSASAPHSQFLNTGQDRRCQ